jgi:hypothetical protein
MIQSMNGVSHDIPSDKADYAEAYNNRGAAYGGNGDHLQAIRGFTKAIEFKPAFTKSYGNRGTAFTQQKDHTRSSGLSPKSLR